MRRRLDRAVEFAIRSFLDGTLEGRSLSIGIERGAVGIVGVSPDVPADIRRKIEKVTELKRKQWASWSTP